MELLIALILSFVTYEAYIWLPNITDWLLARAIRRLPECDRERCQEEWKAALDSLPNSLYRVAHAMSFVVAARLIDTERADAVLEVVDLTLTDLSRMQSNLSKEMRLLKKEVRERVQQITARGEILQREYEEFDRAFSLVRTKIDGGDSIAIDDALHVLSGAVTSARESFCGDQSVLMVQTASFEAGIHCFESMLQVAEVVVRKYSPAVVRLRGKRNSSDVVVAAFRGLDSDLEKLTMMGIELQQRNKQDISHLKLPTLEIEDAFAKLSDVVASVRNNK